MKIRPHIIHKDLLVFLDDNGAPLEGVMGYAFRAKEFWEAVKEYQDHNEAWLLEMPRCGFEDCCGGDCAGVPSITYEGDDDEG